MAHIPRSDDYSMHGPIADRSEVLVHLPRVTPGAKALVDSPQPHSSMASVVGEQYQRAQATEGATHDEPVTCTSPSEYESSPPGTDWLDRRYDELAIEQLRTRRTIARTTAPADYRFDVAHRQPRRRRSQSWAAWLSQLNTSIAPYAALIVTLALVASAGLMYWMITSQPQHQQDYAPFNYRSSGLSAEVTPTESDDDPAGKLSVTMEPKVAPIAIPLMASRSDSPSARKSVANEQPVETSEPTPTEETVESSATTEEPLATELQFPQTEVPEPLDFSKLNDFGADRTTGPSPVQESAPSR